MAAAMSATALRDSAKAIASDMPIVPLCSNTYINSRRLNRWHCGRLIIRAYSPFPLQG